MAKKKRPTKNNKTQNLCNNLIANSKEDVALPTKETIPHQSKNLWKEKNKKNSNKATKKTNSVGVIDGKPITPNNKKSSPDFERKRLNTEVYSTVKLNNCGVDLWKNNLVQEFGENNDEELKHEITKCKIPRSGSFKTPKNSESRVTNTLTGNDFPSEIENNPQNKNKFKHNSKNEILISIATQVGKDDLSTPTTNITTRSRKNKRLCTTNVVTPACGCRSKKNIVITFSPSSKVKTSYPKVTFIKLWKNFFHLIQICNAHFFSKLPSQMLRLCIWCGFFVRKSLTLASELYLTFVNENKHEIDTSEVLLLKSSIDDLRWELQQSKQDDSKTILKIAENFEKIHKELLDFQEKQLDKIMSITQLGVARSSTNTTPPPPPPPPPPPAPFRSHLLNIVPQKLNNERKTDLKNTRPIISLEDILRVKLKKITPDRNFSHKSDSDSLNNFKVHLKPLRVINTPSRYRQSLSNTSSLSNSRSSSRTRCFDYSNEFPN